MTGSDSNWTLPVTVAPSRMASGGVAQPNLDLECPGYRVSLWRDLSHPSDRHHAGIVRQPHCDLRVARRRAKQLGRHVEDGVAPTLPGEPNDHLPGLHHLARFRTSRRHRSGGVGCKGRPADTVSGDPQLSFGVVDLRLRVLQGVLRLIEPGAGCVAVR